MKRSRRNVMGQKWLYCVTKKKLQYLYGRPNTLHIGQGNSKSGGPSLFCLIDLKEFHCSSGAGSVLTIILHL